MKRLFTLFFLASCLVVTLQAQPYYYTPNISGIMSSNGCTGCHGGSGGLSVSYNGLFTGGSSCGPAVIKFNANGSPLVSKIDPTIPNCSGGNMPPSGSVSAANIAIIKEWINTGALQNTSSACADLVISAYAEGDAFNKYLEIYNGTGSAVNLSGYSLRIYSNGGTSVSSTVNLSGTLNHNSYYLVAHPSAALAGLTPSLTSGNLNFNGNDAVALHNGTFNVDVFGQIGNDPGDTGWTNGTCNTADQTWVKNTLTATCKHGAFSGNTAFGTALTGLYTCHPINTASVFNGYVACALPTITPPPASVLACYNVSLPTITLQVPAGGDYTYNVYDSPDATTPIYTGTEFTAPAPGTYIVALFEPATGCEGERYAVNVVQTAQPDIALISQNCSPDNLTYALNFAVSGVAVAEVRDVVTDLVVPLDVTGAGVISGIPSGEGAFIRILDADGCITLIAFEPFTCVQEPACPVLAYGPTNNGTLQLNSGDEFTLTAQLLNVPPDSYTVTWSNGLTGNAVSLTADNPSFCSAQTLNINAQITNVPTGCSAVTLPYNITIYPNPLNAAQLVVTPNGCTISAEVCNDLGAYSIAVQGYAVAGGAIVPGNTYTAPIYTVLTDVTFHFLVEGGSVSTPFTLTGQVECEPLSVNQMTAETAFAIKGFLPDGSGNWLLQYNLLQPANETLSLYVYDLSGKEVASQNLPAAGAAGLHTAAIDGAANLPPGMYVVQLSSRQHRAVSKWVK